MRRASGALQSDSDEYVGDVLHRLLPERPHRLSENRKQVCRYGQLPDRISEYR
ncbi:hypothetical protein D3C80_979940 [compost metagenome]